MFFLNEFTKKWSEGAIDTFTRYNSEVKKFINSSVDKKENKIGYGANLKKFDNSYLPKFILENKEKFNGKISRKNDECYGLFRTFLYGSTL